MGWSLIIGVLTLCSVGYLLNFLVQHALETWRFTRPFDLPILNPSDDKNSATAKAAYFEHLRSMLHEGYKEHKHGFYRIISPTGYLVIASADYIRELSQLPDGLLDLHSASQKRMIGDYTWLQIADELLADTIRTDLTRNLGILLPEILEEVDYCLERQIAPCKDWTRVAFQAIAPTLVAITMGRVLVGEELNKNEDWVSSVTQFVSDVYVGGLKLKRYRRSFRPFAARFLIPEIAQVQQHQARARRLLTPILEQRSANQVLADTATTTKKHDLIQWLLENNAKQAQPRRLDQLAELASIAYVGATNTVATTLTNLLLDIAARPGDQELLRDEAQTVSLDVLNARQALSVKHTSRLDSYMKESQRLSPAHLLTFSRIVTSSITLSNNLTLPAGTHVIVPASMISLDADFFAAPDTFHGFRFSDARADGTKADHTALQFTTTSPRAMHFGYGRNACPGRFFASSVIKVFAVRLLERFEMRLEGERPSSHAVGGRNSVPLGTQILMRKR